MGINKSQFKHKKNIYFLPFAIYTANCTENTGSYCMLANGMESGAGGLANTSLRTVGVKVTKQNQTRK